MTLPALPFVRRLPRLVSVPAFVRWGIRIDTAPAGVWLALLAAALWPT